MFEAYAISVRLELKNLISPQLKLLSEEFTKLEGLSASLTTSLKSIGTEAAGLRTLAAAGNASNRALEKAAASASLLERRLIGIRAASAAGGGGLPLLPMPGGGGGRPGGGNPHLPGGGGRGGGPGGGWHGGNIHMGPGGVGLGTVGMAAGDWFWPLAASGAAIYGGKALYESAKDLDTEKQRFRLLGMSESQNAEAFSYAKSLNVFGTTQVERLAAFREAQGVGRESGLAGSNALQFAKIASPVLAKLDALGQGLDEEGKGALHSSNIALLRFDEQSGGLKSAKEFERIANIGYKLRQSSGGTIDFEQLRAVTARGGAYTQGMSEQGWAYAEPIIQELKGNAYGVGKQTAGTRLFNVMSRTPKNLVEEANRLGLWAPGREHLNEADSKLFKESFERFYIERVMPLYEKFKLTPNDRLRDNAILFGRTGGTIANLIEKQIPSIKASWEAYQKSNSIGDASGKLKGSLSGQELEFSAAWTDFKTQFGTKMLPFFSGILKAGSVVLRALPNASKDATPIGFGAHMVIKLAEVAKWVEGQNRSYVPAGGFGRVPAPTPVILNVDGRKFAEVNTRHQAKAMMAPQTGATRFDDKLSMIPAGGF